MQRGRSFEGSTSLTRAQGSSVAHAFQSAGYRVRGITREPSAPKAIALKAQGMEIVRGDIEDVGSLKKAFQGAQIIFGTTAYSSEAVKPGNQKACYNLELQQGKNIADAAASVNRLELFIWSSLSDAAKWSEGRYQKVHHFNSKGTAEPPRDRT